jgi:hypothetical protein
VRDSTKYGPNALRSDRLEVWAHPLADLIVSDERAEWILGMYPHILLSCACRWAAPATDAR